MIRVQYPESFSDYVLPLQFLLLNLIAKVILVSICSELLRRRIVLAGANEQRPRATGRHRRRSRLAARRTRAGRASRRRGERRRQGARQVPTCPCDT